MNHKHLQVKFLTAALLLAGAQSAFAAGPASGTRADTTITNTASVSYQVGGVPQTAPTAGVATFQVDRLVNVTVAEVSGGYTTVTPGQTARAVTFTVTNNTNSVMDYRLDAANAADPHGGTDSFDPGTYTYYLDDGDGIFNAADTLVTFLDEMAPDAIRTVHVVADIPLAVTDGQIAGVSLQATARDGGVAGTEGALTVQTAGANTAGVDNVFGDLAGTAAGDAARDGKHSASDAYKVAAATISVTKTSTVISDPFNLAVNPKAIPGAVVQYCIAVANASSTTAASNIAVTDPVPTGTTYVAGSLHAGDATCTPTATSLQTDVAGDSNANGTSGSVVGGSVSTVVPTVGANATATTIFNVTIN